MNHGCYPDFNSIAVAICLNSMAAVFHCLYNFTTTRLNAALQIYSNFSCAFTRSYWILAAGTKATVLLARGLELRIIVRTLKVVWDQTHIVIHQEMGGLSRKLLQPG